ncbi:MAG: thiol:disulfide interchange protein [Porticoccaceae bacterium]|jgi:thiol:disulfide interchange protein|tara:strand:- start:949 stop:2703 length:1755 start_codon:yes stop_codon:yes gene_type:complete
MKKITTFIALFILCMNVSTVFAQISLDSEQRPVEQTNSLVNVSGAGSSFVPVEQAYQVSVRVEENQLLLDWSIRDGYYLYRDRFKFNAVDANSQLSRPIFTAGKVKWDEYFEAELEVYYRQTTVILPFQTDAEQLEIQMESQGCADAGLCYPPFKQWLTVDLTSGIVEISATPSLSAKTANRTDSDPSEVSLLWILIFALAGGMILNLMPCVFPVLSIKAMSFAMTHQTEQSKRSHGLAYTAGVVSSFVAIAAVMLSLRAAGEAIGWGFQLQSPLFVIFLIYLFFVMGLAFSGYLEIGSGLTSVGQSADNDDSLPSSFMTGVLATTIASPCTAPFMGPALGYAISQPSYVALLVFAFLGLGMALPFVLLTWIPNLSNKLPRPGQWMDTFKQFLAFPLYLTAVWLLWVAGRQTSVDVAATVIAGLVLIAMAIWLWKLKQASGVTGSKTLAALCIAMALAVPVMSVSKSQEPPLWQPYSEELLGELRQAGKPVFVNLTADWCITCLVNEKVAIGSDAFYQSLAENNITYLKGDWTNNDAKITKLLNQYQRSGVPLYLMYPNGPGEAEILPQILLKSMITAAINRTK